MTIVVQSKTPVTDDAGTVIGTWVETAFTTDSGSHSGRDYIDGAVDPTDEEIEYWLADAYGVPRPNILNRTLSWLKSLS